MATDEGPGQKLALREGGSRGNIERFECGWNSATAST